MSAPAVLLAAALPGAPLVSLGDARDVVQYLVVRLDVETMVRTTEPADVQPDAPLVAATVVLVVLLAGVLLDALHAQHADARDMALTTMRPRPRRAW